VSDEKRDLRAPGDTSGGNNAANSPTEPRLTFQYWNYYASFKDGAAVPRTASVESWFPSGSTASSNTVCELSQLTDREFDDIGIPRGHIEYIVRRSIASQASAWTRILTDNSLLPR
jgi:hypothetical protein